MKIALDIRPALKRGTGVGTFVEQIARAMDSLDGDHSLSLFTSSMKDRWDARRLDRLKRSRIVDKKIPVRMLNNLWHWMGWPPVDFFTGPVDISHSPTPLILPSRGKKIITIHDLHFLSHPQQTPREIKRDYVRLVREHVRKADGILAVSQATADAVQEFLDVPPDRMDVCWEDAAAVYDSPPTREELEQIDAFLPKPYFLFVGTIEPRKNVPALLKAFSIIADKYPDPVLVLAGQKGWGTGSFDQVMESISCRDRIFMSGYRQQRFLRGLYHKAISLVMPSLCEGFGLPLVEAMACGCPIITAHNTAMPEVSGDAALFWHSQDPEELAHLMETLMEDQEQRTKLIEKGQKRRKIFNWKTSAEKVLGLYRKIAD